MLFGPAMGDGRDRTFSIKLRAIPMGVMRPELDDGGKCTPSWPLWELLTFAVILPPRALGLITQYNLQYPLLFQVSNPKYTDRVTHGASRVSLLPRRLRLPLASLAFLLSPHLISTLFPPCITCL